MRVVSGSARGKKLLAVPGSTTRPILDRVKTALFDILRPIINGAVVLDCFAGSGSVGIEALSQGAIHCVFIDIEGSAITTIKKNLKATKLEGKAQIKHSDCFAYLRNTNKKFDLIYVAPPQYQTLWIQALHAIAEHPDLVNKDGQIIVQIDPSEYEQLNLNEFKETQQRKYGNTLLVFYGKSV